MLTFETFSAFGAAVVGVWIRVLLMSMVCRLTRRREWGKIRGNSSQRTENTEGNEEKGGHAEARRRGGKGGDEMGNFATELGESTLCVSAIGLKPGGDQEGE